MVMDRACYLDLPKDLQKPQMMSAISVTNAIFESYKSWDDHKAQGVNKYVPTEAEMELWREVAVNAEKTEGHVGSKGRGARAHRPGDE